MCGLTGLINLQSGSTDFDHILERMNASLTHRGPDDQGLWIDTEKGIGLAHRRLSILDLSVEGHQPMRSADDRYIIAYNGEIYNFRELRSELEPLGHPFKGHSDTEVLLAAVVEWGIDKALTRFNGMFAIALWDRKTDTLHLARDRLGKKPLYLGFAGNSCVFGSELKALAAHPQFECEINRDALALYMRHNYIPAPYSIYRKVQKLKPGTLVSISLTEIRAKKQAINFDQLTTTYWSAKDIVEQGVGNPITDTEAQTTDQLHALLKDAVACRMVSDVPLGAFLSGGIDSSLVVALMQAQSTQPVRSFSIGFHEEEYNEAEHAKAVAMHLGTDHTELYATPAQALEVIPSLPDYYDEPFADSSQIPTYLVSAMTKEHVTVALSGDGGDELFCGYTRYTEGYQIWQKIGWLPAPMRTLVAGMLAGIPPRYWDGMFSLLGPLIPSKLRYSSPGDKLHKLAEVLQTDSAEEMYRRLVSHWKQPQDLVLDSKEPLTALTDEAQWSRVNTFVERMMQLDLVSYLPDDILVKVDRASMATSLEARAPLLDYRVAEMAWRLPLDLKRHPSGGKYLLRQILYQYVPRELIDRPKKGFGVPIDYWLRHELRDWAENLLSEQRLREEGYYDPQPIRKMWEEHQQGKRNWQYHLWDVLMFQAWQDRWMH